MKRKFALHQVLITSLLLFWGSTAFSQVAIWDWARNISTGGHEEINDVVADKSTNDVYIVGEWRQDLSATFPSGANPSTDFTNPYGSLDGLVAKYDSAGNLLWAFKLGGPNNDNIEAIAIDPGGNIYITGFFGTGTNYFSGTSPHSGPSTLDNTAGEDFFIAKYDSNGAFQWVKRSSTNFGNLQGRDLDATSSAVYACGEFDGWATFGPLNTLGTPNQEDIFVVKYNLDGDEQWIFDAGSNGDDFANGVIADDANVYFTGSYDGSNLGINNAGGGTAVTVSNVNNGTEEIILSSFSSNGNHLWSQSISSPDRDHGWGICMDADSLYITGEISNTTSFPGYADNPVSSSGGRDVFISSHSRLDGATGWVASLASSDPGDQRGRSIDTDGNGLLYISGKFSGELYFPQSVILNSDGVDDLFLSGYTTNGVFRWALGAGSTGNEDGLGISTGSQGSLYIGGFYGDAITLGPLILPDDGMHNGLVARLKEVVPLVNDAPCSAELLVVGDTCNSIIYNNAGASDSGLPDPGCGNYNGADLWFKAVVPASGNLFIGTHTSSDNTYPPIDGWMWYVGMSVYSGSCGSLIQEDCALGNSGYQFRAASIFLFDKTPGDSIWIRVWGYDGNENGSFSICAYDPGHYPGWDIPDIICEDESPIDLNTTLSETKFGFADAVVGFSGILQADNATGIPDNQSANLFDDGDWIKLDLTDTIPPGEAYQIYFNTRFLSAEFAEITLWESVDDITYYPHSFKPETQRDIITPHIVFAEHPTRYLLIENVNSGAGGFAVDGIKYFYRGTRGGTWSGPGVSGSLFNPTGLSGPVSITYTVGGSTTSTDSTRTVLVSDSQGGVLSPDTTVCAGGNNISLDLASFKGDIIKWESSVDGFTTVDPLGNTASSYTVSDLTQTTAYRVIVQDASCIPDTSNTVVVNVLENPLADAGSGSIVCGLSVGLQAIPSVGTGTWSAISGPGAVLFTPDENDPYPTVSVDTYGSYEILWTEVNAVCFDRDTIIIDFYEQPQSNPGSYEDVCGDIAMLQAIPSAGTGTWSKTSGPGIAVFSPSASDPGVNINVDQYGTYEFTWTEINGPCSDDSTFSIIFYEAPVIDPGFGGEICGLEFGLNAIPSVDSGFWSMTSGPGTAIFMPSDKVPDAMVTVTEQGVYEFTWTEGTGVCSDQGTIRVEFFDLNEVDAGTGGDVCGLVFNLNAISVTGSGQWSKVSGPGNAVFSPSDTSVNVTVTADDYGDYVFQWYETFDACIGRATVAVSFQMLPVADAGPDQVLEFVFSTYLNARMPETGIGHWEVVRGWGHFADESDPVSQVTELELGENEFSWIIQSIGCDYVSDKVIITVNDVYTPTVFTPNNDGQNDFLVFPGVEQGTGSELIVYNRWGTEVYRSSDYQNDWEGRDHKGRDLIPDTYFYILKPGSERIVKGFVEIRR